MAWSPGRRGLLETSRPGLRWGLLGWTGVGAFESHEVGGLSGGQSDGLDGGR